ncbi:SusC/RagA family TonB-linked outer membrane protein [Halalkalibaculum sp. DA3122]|uniref:SusC/RagA family TonB-linked outer membrane protein n=1 Tax=Halalkalibaculum sp. DA3122 TaxID=3373607 RepID=UPI00375533F7
MNKLRLTIILFMVSMLVQGTWPHQGIAQGGAENKVLLSSTDVMKNLQGKEMVALQDLLTALEQQFDVTFLYRNQVVENKMVPSDKINLEESTQAGRSLSMILQGLDLSFQRIDAQTYVLLNGQPSFRRAPVLEQVTGQVTDASTGETMPGVNVLVKGTTTGTSTDSEGRYELSVPSLQDTLVFSFIGYQRQEVPIDGRTEIDIAMQVQAVSGEELIVVGYGTQQRQNVTGSVNQISGDDIASQPSVQASAALMGKVSGVQVIQNSGQPGNNQGTIRIRGTGTLGNSNPLVLIDGVPGDLDDVPSSDIESISVLKDAASAAVYGSRAANGVILVTTKRGQQDEFQVNYRGFVGWQQPTEQPEFVEGGEFMRLENLGATNLGKQPIWSESYIEEWEANHETNPDEYPNTDWVDLVFSEPGFQQKHHIDISGGTEAIRYLGSISFDDENANVPNFNYKRYNIRLNTDVNVSEKFDFDVDLNVQRADETETAANFSSDNVIQGAYRIPPVYAAKYSNGGWGPGWNGQNPLAFIHDGGLATDEMYKVDGRINATFQPLEELQFELMYAPKYRSTFFREMTKQYEVVDPEGNVQLKNPTQNSLFQQYVRDFTHNANFTAEYQQSFGNHNLNALGGYEFIEFRNDFFNAYRDNFALQNFEQLNVGSEANQQNSGSAESWALQSLFSRVNYDFNSKYLLEANLRYDGSSRFTEDNRWGIFPSFSAGWVISEEPFMESLDIINSLKLRGSWGNLGNQQIGTYPFASIIDLGQSFVLGGNTVSGGAQLDLANSNISWEETETKNVGLDLALLDDQVNFSLDVFERTTTDILLELPIPLIIGLNAPFQNAGEVKNTGWEMQAGYSDNIGTDFSYSVSFNLSDVNNEVTDLKGAGPFISGSSIIQVGDPINAIYGYESDGLFQSQEEIDNHATQSGQIAPGDIKYVDQNGDGLINAADRVVIGDPFPSMNYGISLSANYKNFDFSAFIQGVGSRDVLLQGNAVWALWNAGKVREWQAEDYWTPDNPDASYPRLTQATSHSNFQATDFWVYDASYLRLRNLQVGYTLPNTLTSQLSISNARIFFLGQNLLTLFDDMPQGVDPNVPNGTFGGYFAVNRLLSAGIDINF